MSTTGTNTAHSVIAGGIDGRMGWDIDWDIGWDIGWVATAGEVLLLVVLALTAAAFAYGALTGRLRSGRAGRSEVEAQAHAGKLLRWQHAAGQIDDHEYSRRRSVMVPW